MRTLKNKARLALLITAALFLARATSTLTAQTVLPLPFVNQPGLSYSALTNSAHSSQYTAYTSVSNNDAKMFRGVFIPTNASTKLAIHSDDGSTVKVDGTEKVSKKGQNTQLQNPNSFDVINVSWVVGQLYCIEIDYENGTTNVNDHDGLTLYAYDGGGVADVHPIIRGGSDALCVGQSFNLTADCGESPYAWMSSAPSVATVSDGTVTGVAPGTAIITVTDAENHSTTLTVQIIRTGISPDQHFTCVGLSNTFVLTNAPGTGMVSWSQSGLLSMDTRTNSLAITNVGTNVLTATYGGCSASVTVIVVAVTSLLPSATNICNGGSVVYTNQTTPPGFGHLVNWGGGGLMGTGSSQTNSYTVGTYVVSNWCGTSVKYSTTTVFQLSISPNPSTVFAGSAPIQYALQTNQVPANWSYSPSVAFGATFASSGTGVDSAYVNPGLVGTNYTITATAVGLSSCVATAALNVVKLTLSSNLVAVCEGGSVSLSFSVQPASYLGQIAFDTVTNSSGLGPANTHATVSVSGTNLTITGFTNSSAWLRAQIAGISNLPTAIKIVRVTFPTNAWYLGESNLSFFGTQVDPPGAPVTYASANTNIAAAGGSGTNVSVAGITNGVTQIQAVVGGQVCSQKDVTVARVTLTPSELDMCVGQSNTLALVTIPAGVPVVISSDTPAVASAMLNGGSVTVGALNPGRAEIRAKLNDSTVARSSLYCIQASFATNDFYVAVSNVNYLEVRVPPEVTAARVRFVSADTNIATVSGKPGMLKVRGVSVGTTAIQAWAGTNQLCVSKTVNVIQPAISSVEWVNLDRTALTNGNPNAGGGLMIFADSPTPGAAPENRVRIRARVAPPVAAGAMVYFRVIDVDDPSANTTPLDDETSSTDNKGSWSQVSMNPVATDSNSMAEIMFTTSMQPGDNFRAVAGLSAADISSIAARQNDAVNAGLTNTTGAMIPAAQVSSLLTIWRRLHVEVDTMGAVPAGANAIGGQITAIYGSSSSLATQIMVSVNLAAGDSSFNLDTGDSGRFENGSVLINTSTPPAITEGILGNGANYFRTETGESFNIPFTLTAGAATVSGQIRNMDDVSDNTIFGVSVSLTPNAFNGGTLTIAGQSYAVLQNSAETVTVPHARLSFLAIDDDDNSLLPLIPDTSGVEEAFAPAYVMALISDLPNPRRTMPFQLNSPANEATRSSMTWDTEKMNKDTFWVAYVVSVFQFDTTHDGDPDGEQFSSYIALGGTFNPDGGSMIFREAHAERSLGLSEPDERETIHHELSHNFNSIDAVGQPMDTDGSFTPLTLNHIRSTTKPRSK